VLRSGRKDLLGLAVAAGAVVSTPVEKGVGSRVLTLDARQPRGCGRDDRGFRFGRRLDGRCRLGNRAAGGVKPALVDNDFNRTPHPRTAVGVTRDGRYMILLAIDGRQPGYSVGATMHDVADWLLRLGASEGLNLDGGGSTALVRERDGQPELLNQPSGVALGSSDNTGKKGGERLQRSNGNNFGLFAKPLPAAR
jgi:hypothetical protein